ncbi:MAG TPA: hypothetical protein VFE34_14320 [Dongiaceae bacterium]|jgi:hypothetical protein|nr:hypothetical protein [Dongiaceae bacterium]
MTFALTNWFSRLLSVSTRFAPDAPDEDQPPMKIEVEHLPDYLWRELGFQPTSRPGEDLWRP